MPTCPLREEKSFSQRAFSIYTDIRKLQDKAKTSYTLRTRRIRSEKRNQKQYKKSRDEVQGGVCACWGQKEQQP